MKLITLVIAEHNEGDQLKDTLESLYETSDRSLYDVIVVSDGSEVDPKVFGGAIHLNTGKRRGVGAAFDLGAEHVKTPYMVIMGSDVRFVDNGYLNKMVAYLSDTENEKSIITSVNVGLNADQMEFDEGRHRYGARTCFFLTAKDLPKKGTVMSRFKDDKAVDEYRNILEAKWIEKWGNGIYDISCVLGAFYGVRTDWYRHIMGFRGHLSRLFL